jgi:hypothetical protein
MHSVYELFLALQPKKEQIRKRNVFGKIKRATVRNLHRTHYIKIKIS